MPKTRPVDMVIGEDDRTWTERRIHIPANTPEDKIEQVAEKQLADELSRRREAVSFILTFFVPDLEEEDEETEE